MIGNYEGAALGSAAQNLIQNSPYAMAAAMFAAHHVE
jgi:hypothetical protein